MGDDGYKCYNRHTWNQQMEVGQDIGRPTSDPKDIIKHFDGFNAYHSYPDLIQA